MPGVQAGLLRLIHYSNYTCSSILATLFIFSVTPRGSEDLEATNNSYNNGELPLLPLGAAAAKRYIYYRYQHQSITWAL